MEGFVKQGAKKWFFELLVDKEFFCKEALMRAAYKFLDLWYFFFKLDKSGNYVVEFSAKDAKSDTNKLIWDFYNELLNVELRIKMEKKNWKIREKIVDRAIWMSLDFVNLAREWENENKDEFQTIDFDKDIDEILKELENDPDLQIDKAEIEKILKEIEEETNSQDENKDDDKKENVTLDVNWVKDAKKKFKNRK